MSELALFALNTVLFPDGRLNARVFEKRYLDMVSACMKASSPFGVCLIARGAEVGAAAQPQKVGTLAHIVRCDLEQPGILQVVARGGERFRIRSTTVCKDQLLLAEVDCMVEQREPMLDRHRPLVDVLRRTLAKAGADSYFPPPRWDDAVWVAGRLAELLPLPLGLKQALLEMDQTTERLDTLAEFFPGSSAGARNP